MDISISDAHQFFNVASKSSALKEQFEKNEQNYHVKLQVAQYFKLSENYKNNQCISVATTDEDDQQVYFIFGNQIPEPDNKQDYESFKVDFIQHLNPRIEKNFIIVFFNTNQLTANSLNVFKDFYATLPRRYFIQLQAFIVVHANFIVKSGGMFGQNEIQKFFKKLTTYQDTLLLLSKEKWFRFRMLGSMHPSIKTQDQSYKDIEQQRRNVILKKQITQQQFDEEEAEEEDVNDFDKECKILGQHLETYERNKHSIPIILDILVQYFEEKEHLLATEGLFRKQAAVYEERILEAALACQKISFINKVENPHTAGGVFKQFFLQLKEPLMTYAIYDFVVENTRNGSIDFQHDKLNAVKIILSKLPALNLLVLGFTIHFVNRIVQFKEQNLMTTYNMAVVFGPSFFRSKVLSMLDMQYINLFVSLVQTMLDNASELFPNIEYTKLLEKRTDAFNMSMVPFLTSDAANLNEILDMIGEDKLLPQNCLTEEELMALQMKQSNFNQVL